jgi:hypothetical protein
MDENRTHLYKSENGDCWLRCTPNGTAEVLHEPNAARSGGAPSRVGIAEFLSDGRNGPEHQALRRVLAESMGIA